MMSPQLLRRIGIALLVVCVISVFLGWQQYQSNADAIAAINAANKTAAANAATPVGGDAPDPAAEAMNQMTDAAVPGPSQFGGTEQKPGVPITTIVALLLALLTGVGGAVCAAKGKSGAVEYDDDEEYEGDDDFDESEDIGESTEPDAPTEHVS